MIPETQRTYVLELLVALGPAAADFVVAGAQAIKFSVPGARGTKDVDFILNVIALREESVSLEGVLKKLGYTAVEGARNFQFEKAIPNNSEKLWLSVNETLAIGVEASKLFLHFEKRACVVTLGLQRSSFYNHLRTLFRRPSTPRHRVCRTASALDWLPNIMASRLRATLHGHRKYLTEHVLSA